MKHPKNSFTHAIRSGEKQIGLWVSLTSEVSADIVAGSGYDWVVLDMEHSPNEIPSILTQLNVFKKQYGYAYSAAGLERHGSG